MKVIRRKTEQKQSQTYECKTVKQKLIKQTEIDEL